MKVIDLIRGLSLEEREQLALEVKYSVNYLNGLNTDTRKPSIQLVYGIYRSELNKGLPKGARLLKDEFQDYVDWYLEATKHG